MITNPQHALTLGALNLIGTDADQAATGYQFRALADDRDWGNPISVEQKITSWLQDGSLVTLTRQENRQMFLRIQVLGDDSNDLALATEALMFECYKRNLLTWTPPDGVGEPCVFTVVMSSFEEITDDLDDLRVIASLGLTIQALPFVRSQELTTITIPAPTGTQVITPVDDCTSTSGWTGGAAAASSTSVVTSGGAVRTLTSGYAIGPSSYGALFQTRTGLSASLATPYLRVQATVAVGAGMVLDSTLAFTFNGISVPVAAQYGDVYWFDTTGLGLGATLTDFDVRCAVYRSNGGADTASISVFDISRSNVLGEVTTGRQTSRIIEVPGSARTPANVAIEDATDALGTTLVYTSPVVPGMVQPNLRALTSAGPSPTPDASTISGFTSDLEIPHAFDVPIAGLQEGGYLLLARVKHASSGDRVLVWTAQSRQGSTSLGSNQGGTLSVPLTAGEYSVITVATMNLPPRLMGSAGVVQIELASGPGVVLDEAWIFNTDTGELTWVECGDLTPAAGGSSNRLFIDSPTLERPRHTLYRGTAADRSDSFHVASEMDSLGEHEFVPRQTNVFLVTSNSQAAAITFSAYRNYHSRVVAA